MARRVGEAAQTDLWIGQVSGTPRAADRRDPVGQPFADCRHGVCVCGRFERRVKRGHLNKSVPFSCSFFLWAKRWLAGLHLQATLAIVCNRQYLLRQHLSRGHPACHLLLRHALLVVGDHGKSGKINSILFLLVL